MHRFEVLVDRTTDFHIAPPNQNDLRDLSTLSLDVALNEPLEVVAERAEHDSGMAPMVGINIHFVTAPNSEGRRYLAPFSPYVSVDGEFTWAPGHIPRGWGFHSIVGVSVEDVLRTKREGFFDGDPFALLIEERRGAGGFVPSWIDLNTFFDQASVAYGKAALVAGSIKTIRFMVRTYQEQWELHHATPLRPFVTILERDAWHYPDLARRLAISLPNVVDLLTVLGYEQDGSEPLIYRISRSPDRAQLRAIFEDEFLQGNPRQALRDFWSSQGREPPRR